LLVNIPDTEAVDAPSESARLCWNHFAIQQQIATHGAHLRFLKTSGAVAGKPVLPAIYVFRPNIVA
jgi:hypothetical protein